MKHILNTLKSTAFNDMLIKLSLFFTLMALSLVSVYFTIAAFFLIIAYGIIEFSYNSAIWLMMYIASNPYAPTFFIILSLFAFTVIFLAKFIVDIVRKNINLRSTGTILVLSIGAIVCLLFLIPFAPYYSLLISLFEVSAIIILVILFINYTNIDVKSTFIIFAIYIAAFCIIHNFMVFVGLYEQIYICIGTTIRYSFFVNDPNYTAGILLIAITAINVLNKKSEINSWVYYSLFIVLGVCLINTISKSGFIVYTLILLVLLLDILIRLLRTKSKESLTELIMFVASITLICLISHKALGATISRFVRVTTKPAENRLSELTTDRSGLFSTYLQEIFSSPYKALFGHGTTAPMLEFKPNDFRDTHSLALTMLYKYGVLISVLIITMYLIAFFRTKQKIKWYKIALACLMLLMFMSLSARLFTQIYLFFFIFIVACGVKENSSSS